jgi:hypothetical protein
MERAELDQLDGWQRLWVFFKWITTLGVAFYCMTSVPSLPGTPGEAPPTAGTILLGLLIAGGVCGVAVYLFLSALEWVYRGFRPLPTNATNIASSLITEQHQVTIQRGQKQVKTHDKT